jgi:hypothetical protein
MRVQQTTESRLVNWQWIVAAGLIALAIVVALVSQAQLAPRIGAGPVRVAPERPAQAAPLGHPTYGTGTVYNGQPYGAGNDAPAQAAPLGHPTYGTGTVYDGQPYGNLGNPSWPDNYGAGYIAPAQAAPLGHPTYGTGTVYNGQPHGAGYYDAYAGDAARTAAQAQAAASYVPGYEAPAGAELSQLPRGFTDYLQR